MFKHLCLALGLLMLLAGCDRQPPLVQQESYVFGTRVEILVADLPEPQAREAAGAVLREFDRLHRTYHAWQASELSALNAALAAGRTHLATPEMLAFVREAKELARLSGYRFDPGIGRLIALWGFHADEFKAALPDAAAIDAMIDAVLAANPAAVADVRNGVGKATGFLIGQAMQASGGKANPKLIKERLSRKLINT